jgi:ribosomal protein S27AE
MDDRRRGRLVTGGSQPEHEHPLKAILDDDRATCGFCGADEDEVDKLFAGDEALICNHCFLEAVALIVGRASDSSSDTEYIVLPCSFCHVAGPARNVMAATELQRICERCLAGILVAIAEDLGSLERNPVVLELPRRRGPTGGAHD